MLSGGDTRDLAVAPTFTNFSRVGVRPGEGAFISFDVTNRFNQTITGATVTLGFQVGGDWLQSRPVRDISSPPTFDPSGPVLPADLAPNASMQVRQHFSTSGQTPAGPYLVTVVLKFTYANATNVPTGAIFQSLGSLSAAQRGSVNLTDMNGTLNALQIDGVAPDSAIVVDAGQAATLFLWAVGFGVAVVAAGACAGAYWSRKGRPRKRKGA
jgi:hypothetical protein